MDAKRFRTALLLPASLCALVACTSIAVKTTPYPGLQKLAATDPDKVEILRAAPARPHEKLGEIQIDSSNDPAPPLVDLATTLQEEAAKLGADAVAEREGQGAQQGGEGRHHDRPEAEEGGLVDRLGGCVRSVAAAVLAGVGRCPGRLFRRPRRIQATAAAAGGVRGGGAR